MVSDRKDIVNMVADVAKQAARLDYEDGTNFGSVHAKYFQKYYDLELEKLPLLEQLKENEK